MKIQLLTITLLLCAIVYLAVNSIQDKPVEVKDGCTGEVTVELMRAVVKIEVDKSNRILQHGQAGKAISKYSQYSIILNDTGYEALSHEVYHIVHFITNERGIDDHETEAYLNGYIFKRANDIINSCE